MEGLGRGSDVELMSFLMPKSALIEAQGPQTGEAARTDRLTD